MNTARNALTLTSLILASLLPIRVAAVQFSDVAAGIGIVTSDAVRGAAWGDYDEDGCLDLLTTTFSGGRLYRNSCSSPTTFSDETGSAGLSGNLPSQSTAAVWADYDGDGDLDAYVTSQVGANALFDNQGNGSFLEVGGTAGVDDARGSAGAAFGDYDGDGDLDLFVVNRFDGADNSDALFRNNGDGTFTDMAVSLGVDGGPGRLSFQPAWFDYDHNGTLDLYVSVDFGDDVLYSNDGDGTFTDVSVSAGISYPPHGMGVGIGDFNSDGCLDVFVSNNTQGDPADAEHGPSAVYENDCNGGFQDVATSIGILDRAVVEWGGNWVDYDNDMDEDLSVMAGGMLSSGEPNAFYENDLGLLFDITVKSGGDNSGAAFGSAWADYDNDGDLDWFVCNTQGAPALFENIGPVGTWIKVRLHGAGANTHGVGARVELEAGSRIQTKVIQAGKSYLSGEELAAWFGLGVKDTADSIRVEWPSGQVSLLADIAAGQAIDMVEPAVAGSVQGTVTNPSAQPEEGARVRLHDRTTQALLADVPSDVNGFYSFGSLAPGSYFVVARKSGFSTSPRFRFSIVATETVTADLQLQP